MNFLENALNPENATRWGKAGWVFGLTVGWYLTMLTMEVPRTVLMGDSDELPGNAFLAHVLFGFVTAGMIAAFFYVAPGIRGRGRRILFSVPFPFVAATIFVLTLSLYREIRAGRYALEPQFWTAHLVLVPIALLFLAWFPLLVMYPLTVWVQERMVVQRRREQAVMAGLNPESSCLTPRPGDAHS